jgi:hypothetical protein
MVKNEDDSLNPWPDFSYKVKKSANFGFLDFTTLEKRKYYCQQEAGLNRRLGKGAIIPAVVEKIASKIAHFHAQAAPSPEMSKFGNIQTIRPGFETSDEALQARTGGKVDNQDFRVAVENLKRAGYAGEEIGVYLLVGFPGQSAGEVEESISAAAVKEAGAKPILGEYSPRPGIPMFEDAPKSSPVVIPN